MYQVQTGKGIVADYTDVEGKVFEDVFDALDECAKMYDKYGFEYNYYLKNIEEPHHSISVHTWSLNVIKCDNCGIDIRFFRSYLIRDCHGTPTHRVCRTCYKEITESPDFDGVYFKEE